MYKYSSAVCKKSRDWVNVDISTMSLKDVYQEYDEIRVRLSHIALSSDVEMNLESVRNLIRGEVRTIVDWLLEFGGNLLPTYSEVTNIYVRFAVTYNDCHNLDLTVKPADINMHVDTVLPREMLDDLYITGANVNFDELNKNALFMVNGIIHPSYSSGEGIYIKGGDVNSRHSNNASVGYIDFTSVGNITTHPITSDMFYRPDDAQDIITDGVFLQTGINLTNKTLMLVLGGTLHALDNSYSEIGTDIVKLNLSMHDYTEIVANTHNRIVNREWLDEIMEDGILNVSELLTEEYITKLLTDDYTYFVTIDRTDICSYTYPVSTISSSKSYSTTIRPHGILMSERGLHGNYVILKEHDRYVIFSDWLSGYKYNFVTTTFAEMESIDFKISTLQSYNFNSASILNLYTLTGVPFMPNDIPHDDSTTQPGAKAPMHHRHTVADIDGLENELEFMRSNIHTHSIVDIIGLTAELELMNERLKVIDGGIY